MPCSFSLRSVFLCQWFYMQQPHRILGQQEPTVFSVVPTLIRQQELLSMEMLDLPLHQQLLRSAHIRTTEATLPILQLVQTREALSLRSLLKYVHSLLQTDQLISLLTRHTAQLECIHPESIAPGPQALPPLEQRGSLYLAQERTSSGSMVHLLRSPIRRSL